MMDKNILQGLHVITDSHSALSPVEQAHMAAKNGAAIVQLRDKKASDLQMEQWAQEILEMIAPYSCRLIINDRLNVALQSRAHGLHVGQKDGNIQEIRAEIGPDMILGLSITHPDQVKNIPPDIVDYIGVGPLRETSSKKDHDVPLGYDGLNQIISAANRPAIAIGGITLADLPALKKAGVSGVAVISAISQNKDPEKMIRLFAETWQNLT